MQNKVENYSDIYMAIIIWMMSINLAVSDETGFCTKVSELYSTGNVFAYA